MKVTLLEPPGPLLIEPTVHRDARGYFLETYHASKYEQAGMPGPWLQDNHSFSRRGTLRGLHAQSRQPQGKLVRALEGEIFDVAVDIRRGSPTLGRWVGVRLSGATGRQLYVPPGFAHGFCVLSESVHVEYKCTRLYDPDDEIVVAWNDPEVGIAWPVSAPTLSPRDAAAPALRELTNRLPPYEQR